MRAMLMVVVLCSCDSEAQAPVYDGRVNVTGQWVLDYTTCPGGKPVKGPSLLPFEAVYDLGVHQYRETWMEGSCIKSLASSYDVGPHGMDAWMRESQIGCAPVCESAWSLRTLP